MFKETLFHLWDTTIIYTTPLCELIGFCHLTCCRATSQLCMPPHVLPCHLTTLHATSHLCMPPHTFVCHLTPLSITSHLCAYTPCTQPMVRPLAAVHSRSMNFFVTGGYGFEALPSKDSNSKGMCAESVRRMCVDQLLSFVFIPSFMCSILQNNYYNISNTYVYIYFHLYIQVAMTTTAAC